MSLWTSQISENPQTLELVFEAAQRAVALNASSPWGHTVLSAAYLSKKQYEQASAEAERALALNPSIGWIYADLANTLSFLGRSEEALGLAEKALHLSPRLHPGLFRFLEQIANGFTKTESTRASTSSARTAGYST